MAENKKLDAREIISELFDEGSFIEIGEPSSSVITGIGTIDGASVYSFVQDMNERSGAVSAVSAAKIKRLYDSAVQNGSPVAAFYNSKGGDINEGAALLDAFGGITSDITRLSGVVPQISVVTGLCTGVLAAACRMADFVIMTNDSELFLNGSGDSNAAKSGIADIIVKDSAEAVETVKKLIKILPQNNLEPAGNDYYEINDAEISADLKGADLVGAVADIESLIELNADRGISSYTALGSLNWHTTGFVVTNKDGNSGMLTADDCSKIAGFVNVCDAFSIPVVTVIDTEGFESGSNVRDAAKLAQVYGSASSSRISLVTGNAVGAAFIALGSLRSGTDFLMAYENAVISPVNPKAAAVLLNADKMTADNINSLTKEYIESEAGARSLLTKGYIDRIIAPEETRKALLSALEMTVSKRVSAPNRKHINIKF